MGFETTIKYNEQAILKGRSFEIPEFGFDIRSSSLEVVKDPYGLILWTLIKTCHITEERFDQNVMESVQRIRKYKPKEFDEFMACVSNLIYNENIGIKRVGISSMKMPDLTFWLGVWYYIEYPERFRYKFEAQIYNIHPEFLL
jgi:hypothetical protein